MAYPAGELPTPCNAKALTSRGEPADCGLVRSLPCRPAADRVLPSGRLTLGDGTERLYLLDDPDGYPAAMVRCAVYDPYVHLAYLLACQGHGASWLARFTGLPLTATVTITEVAALTHARRTGTPPPASCCRPGHQLADVQATLTDQFRRCP